MGSEMCIRDSLTDDANTLTAFNSDGFSIGSDANTNNSTDTTVLLLGRQMVELLQQIQMEQSHLPFKLTKLLDSQSCNITEEMER